MKRLLKWLAAGVATLLLLALAVGGYQLYAFDQAANTVYDLPTPAIVASTDSAVIARGKHIAESFGGCAGCHGPNLGGSLVEDMGPIGVMNASNLTSGEGGVGSLYTDEQLARVLRHGVDADGRSLLFMPTAEHNWLPDEDVQAVVSYVRSMPPVSNSQPAAQAGPLGKLLTQFGVMPLFSVQETLPTEKPPAPEPTARYGEFLARGCTGCHGPLLAGGPIPGAPASLPKPANLTPHESGLAGWTEETFRQVVASGVRPDGRALDPFMPMDALRNLDEVEFTAIWAYLQSLPAHPYGTR